ncbi:hypothetical protein LRP31_32600 (plasmid) [Mesorhizobium mediterraneum]|uniref:hypothetical protein n=1 Tax=Mesorhizobium mediterraneum TaxID=43617 RepID=UPI001FDA82FE|nr:hypothetical protein [Mesorhizobium mediterraneum]WIW57170.1 hypothetical protein LRP31_32600 [Mesorhizobium mediterraneum]
MIRIEVLRIGLTAVMSPCEFIGFALFTGRLLGPGFNDARSVATALTLRPLQIGLFKPLDVPPSAFICFALFTGCSLGPRFDDAGGVVAALTSLWAPGVELFGPLVVPPCAFIGFALFTGCSLGPCFDDAGGVAGALTPLWAPGVELFRPLVVPPCAFLGFTLFTGRSLGTGFNDAGRVAAALPWVLGCIGTGVFSFRLRAPAPPGLALLLETALILCTVPRSLSLPTGVASPPRVKIAAHTNFIDRIVAGGRSNVATGRLSGDVSVTLSMWTAGRP